MYSINLPEHQVVHTPTYAVYQIGEEDRLIPKFLHFVPPEQRELVLAGAIEALRQERNRHPLIRWQDGV